MTWKTPAARIKLLILTHDTALAELWSGVMISTGAIAGFLQGNLALIYVSLAVFVGIEQIGAVLRAGRKFRSWSAFHTGIVWVIIGIPHYYTGQWRSLIGCGNMFLLNIICYLANRGRLNGSAAP